MPVSIWEEHFGKVESSLFYKLTAMKLRQFNGLVLSTQRFTEIDAWDSFGVTETQTPTDICCPNVLNGIVNIYPICNNPSYKKKKLIAPTGAIIATSSACSRKLLLKEAEIDINIYLQLQNQDGQITAVTVFPPKITDILDEEILEEAKGNPDQLLEKFLLLENHDFFLSNFRSNIVSSIKEHGSKYVQ